MSENYPNIVYVNKQPFYDIANAIRYKLNSDHLIKPYEMASKIEEIYTNEIFLDFSYGGAFILTKTISQPVPFYITNNTQDISDLFGAGTSSVSLLSKIQCPDGVLYMSRAYSRCNYSLLENPEYVCSDTVLSMDNAYYGPINCKIKNAVCGNNVILMGHAYGNSENLEIAACGPNVTNMYGAYANCPNLKQAACGDAVKYMHVAYANCVNLKQAISGPNVTNMYGAYEYCYNITDAEIMDNVQNITRCFYNCYNLKNVKFGNNVEIMPYAFYGCNSLKYAIFSPKTTDANHSYSNTNNILSTVITGYKPFYENSVYKYMDLSNCFISSGIRSFAMKDPYGNFSYTFAWSNIRSGIIYYSDKYSNMTVAPDQNYMNTYQIFYNTGLKFREIALLGNPSVFGRMCVRLFSTFSSFVSNTGIMNNVLSSNIYIEKSIAYYNMRNTSNFYNDTFFNFIINNKSGAGISDLNKIDIPIGNEIINFECASINFDNMYDQSIGNKIYSFTEHELYFSERWNCYVHIIEDIT